MKRNKLGVLGYPIDYTLSPKIHMGTINSYNYDLTYEKFKVTKEELKDFVASVKREDSDILGFNVTIPYKEEIIPYLDELTPEAKIVGAVNTVVYKDGILVGHNTDGLGFVRYLREIGVEPQGKSFLVIGYGGAAKGIIGTLIKEGAKEINICGRDPLKGFMEVANIMNQGVMSQFILLDTIKKMDKEDVVIQTTPLECTSHNQTLKLPYYFTRADQVAIDIVYDPLETNFLKEFKKRRCVHKNGLGMLLHQGVISFEYMTGLKSNIEIMKKELGMEND